MRVIRCLLHHAKECKFGPTGDEVSVVSLCFLIKMGKSTSIDFKLGSHISWKIYDRTLHSHLYKCGEILMQKLAIRVTRPNQSFPVPSYRLHFKQTKLYKNVLNSLWLQN